MTVVAPGLVRGSRQSVSSHAVFLSRLEVVLYERLHVCFFRVPAPATLLVQSNVGVRIKIETCKRLMSCLMSAIALGHRARDERYVQECDQRDHGSC